MWLIIFPDLNRDIPSPGKVIFEEGRQAKLRVVLDITEHEMKSLAREYTLTDKFVQALTRLWSLMKLRRDSIHRRVLTI